MDTQPKPEVEGLAEGSEVQSMPDGNIANPQASTCGRRSAYWGTALLTDSGEFIRVLCDPERERDLVQLDMIKATRNK